MRFRTVGDVTCTGCVESTASPSTRSSPRSRRPGHRTRRHLRRRPVPEAGMEDRKRRATMSANTTLLRIATAGSADDGKSTLRPAAATTPRPSWRTSWLPSNGRRPSAATTTPTSALVTDGLRAEREQGITIDVAYRYFATANRKFIIADTPGTFSTPQHGDRHVHGAAGHRARRRPGTGCSSSPPARLLASLLGQHIVLAVNKMDLIDWDRERLETIRRSSTRSPPAWTSTT